LYFLWFRFRGIVESIFIIYTVYGNLRHGSSLGLLLIFIDYAIGTISYGFYYDITVRTNGFIRLQIDI
jgi:hypothetical protein